MIDQIDQDGNGEIDFAEFVALMAEEMQESLNKEEILVVFKRLDKEGVGSISHADFKRILSRLGEKLTDVEMNEIISEIDNDQDGRIEFEEFFRVMMPDQKL